MHRSHVRPPRFEGLETRALFAIWHVAPLGTDGAAGTSDAPWRTLQFAADQVQPGDLVDVAPGEYVGFQLTRDGASAAPIVFRGQPGAKITSRNSRTPDGINLEGADYIEIEGFEIVGMPRAGIRSVLNTHVTLRGNFAHDNQRWGIFSGFSEAITVEDNVTTNSVLEHGIYLSNSADRPIVRRNTVAHNFGSGIQINADASEGGDGIITDALIEANVIYRNGAGGGSAINLDGVQNSRIYNNLLYQNRGSGISLYQIDGGGSSHGNQIMHNSVLQAVNGRWALNIQDASVDNMVQNNVLLSLHASRGSIDISADSLPGFVSNHNVLTGRLTVDGGNTRLSLSAWRAATGQDVDSLVADPNGVFRDWAQDDYRLFDGSVAIDRGVISANVLRDIDEAFRPQGLSSDIGAYEWPKQIAGDVNLDGVVNSADIDDLRFAVRNNDAKAQYDVDQSGVVNADDVDHLLAEVLKTGAGDANLDGLFDTSDLIAIFQRGEFEDGLAVNSGWADGDWDGDGEFTSADIIAAFQRGGYAG